MHHHTHVFQHTHWLQALIALGLACAAGPGLATPIEHEVDTTGVVGAVAIAYGDHTLGATLANALEVDRFTFMGQAGDSARVLLHTLAGGLDPALVLRSPTGTTLASASCSGNDGFGRPILCSTALDWTLSETGRYTVNLSDIGADEAGAYQLQLETYPPKNNWVGFAYGTPPVAESLALPVDMDFYAFNGALGTQVRLTVRTATGGLDPYLEVWDPSGLRISDTLCNGNDGFGRPILCTNSVDLNLTMSGAYKIGLRDSGLDETGNYRLQVNCLFGDCPSTVPSPVPEAASLAYLLAGLPLLLLLAWRRRA